MNNYAIKWLFYCYYKLLPDNSRPMNNNVHVYILKINALSMKCSN